MMRSRLLRADGPRVHVVVLDEGDEILDSLRRFAREHRLAASRFTAIGALRSVALGFRQMERRRYDRIELGEQVEVLGLHGFVTEGPDGEPMIHAHIVVGLASGEARGGHLLEGVVRPTLELVLTEEPAHLRRRHDEATGLALIDLPAEGA